MKRTKFIMAALLMASAATAYGQEKTIEVQNLNDRYSIVRETRDGKWLVSNYINGQSRFSLIDEMALSTPQLILGYIDGTDSTRINDFEIFRDTVYFCGQTWREKTPSAIWGYFPLSGFPSVNVQYEELAGDSFSKIDLFSVDTTTYDLHVVITMKFETIINLYDGIYDIVRDPSGDFIPHAAHPFDIFSNPLFYDIAVTDNYIAAGATTSTHKSILFFDKPTTLGTSFLTGVAYNYTIPNNYASFDISLEDCTNDALVAAYSVVGGEIYVLSFNGTSPAVHLKINNTNLLSTREIKYDQVSEDLDILANPYTITHRSDSSVILHLNQSLVAFGGPLFCHVYMSEKLNSLDWLSTQKDFFVASGHDADQNRLRVYKYRYNNWGNCTKQAIKEAEIMDPGEKPGEIDYFSSTVEAKMLELKSYTFENPLKVICE